MSPYTPTPSTHSTLNAELYQGPNTTTSQDLRDISSPISEAPSPGAQIRRRAIARTIAASTHLTEGGPGSKQHPSRDHGVNVLVPYYAGEHHHHVSLPALIALQARQRAWSSWRISVPPIDRSKAQLISSPRTPSNASSGTLGPWKAINPVSRHRSAGN